jgi:branched-chain amino acid transport system ATP-binding protein
VLHDVDFAARRRRITTILGANGAGKTTTLRALCQMVRTTGSMTLRRPVTSTAGRHRGHRAHGRRPRARRPRHLHALSVEENLRWAPIRAQATRPPSPRTWSACFALFPRLQGARHQQAGTLSGGEQQMLAISRALMLRPQAAAAGRALVRPGAADRAEIFRILRDQRGGRVSMLLVEQNANLALTWRTHAYLLETGRWPCRARPSRSLKNDESVRRAYLGY